MFVSIFIKTVTLLWRCYFIFATELFISPLTRGRFNIIFNYKCDEIWYSTHRNIRVLFVIYFYYYYRLILLGTNLFGLPDTRRRSCCSWSAFHRILFSGSPRCSWSARTLHAISVTKNRPVFSLPSRWWCPRIRWNFFLRKTDKHYGRNDNIKTPSMDNK